MNMVNSFMKIASIECYVLLKFVVFWFALFFVIHTFIEVGKLGDPANSEFGGNESFTDEANIIGLIVSPAVLSVSHPLAPVIDYLSILQKRLIRAHWHTIVSLEAKHGLVTPL